MLYIVVLALGHFYIVLFSSLEQTHCAFVACDFIIPVTVALYSALRITTQAVLLQRCLVLTWLVPHESAVISARSVYTIQPCTIIMLSHHFMQNHIRRVHGCLAVTSHLHIWQNDRDFLHATVVTG